MIKSTFTMLFRLILFAVVTLVCLLSARRWSNTLYSKLKVFENEFAYDDEWLTATGAACTVCATAIGWATTAGACETMTPGAALAMAKTQAIAN